MSFRDNLREALDFTGMEQKELAAQSGVSFKAIETYVKKDSSIPSADKAVQIAKALGVTVEYLINGNKSKKPDTYAIQPHQKEALDLISKLNKTNHELLISIVKTMLTQQTKKP
jgi:transcriptional regulator with XRE-family HTH domain